MTTDFAVSLCLERLHNIFACSDGQESTQVNTNNKMEAVKAITSIRTWYESIYTWCVFIVAIGYSEIEREISLFLKET